MKEINNFTFNIFNIFQCSELNEKLDKNVIIISTHQKNLVL